MRIKSQRDFFAGLLYVVVGGGFAIGATNYTIGDASRMGPGYFPLMVGALLAILGAIIIVQSLVLETPDGDPIGRWGWRPLIYIIVANFLFGILLGGIPTFNVPPMGVMIAIVVLTFVAALGGHRVQVQRSVDSGHHPDSWQLGDLHLGLEPADASVAELPGRLNGEGT